MFVDYAGAGIPIHNRATGEIHQAAIFVGALGVSSYTFAEATWSQELPCWIGSHIRALEYFGGLPMLVVPDFVPGHKIRLLWRVALCGLGRARARRICVQPESPGT